MTFRLPIILAGALLLPVLAFSQYGVPAEDVFPTAPVIEQQKAFWLRIFTEVGSNEGLFHDTEGTQPVYEKLDLRGLRRRARREIIRSHRAAIEQNLRELAQALDDGAHLTPKQQGLLGRFPEGVASANLREAARNVRFQRGLADRFRQGLVESGAYNDRMQDILESHGVPRSLAYLPHVESSFNIRSYSRAGAAGIWQFTRGTGKEFMRVAYEVDERLDPLRATKAAAEFLAENYRVLGTWPLAITAYNHGRQSLERAVRHTGTDDLSYLITNYEGRRFKFASKNFYAEFLAAREVVQNYRDYFGELEFKAPLRFQEVELPFYLDFEVAAQAAGISRAWLTELNPSLRPPVLQGTKYIPKGHVLRLPETSLPEAFLAAVPDVARHTAQRRTTEVIVARGDTLYGIGRRFNVPWRQIALANNISAHRRIHPGQRLLIPTRDQLAVAAAAPSPSPPATVAPEPPSTPAAPQAAALRAAPRIDVADVAQAGAGLLPDSLGLSQAEGAMLFQDLDLHDHNPETQRAELITAYGETLGHYADWAGVSTNHIRRINDLDGWVLRPGERVVVSLENAAADLFLQQRHEFHRSREEDLFSVYAVLEVAKLPVRRGDTVWSIAQSNNVPMWLFYQYNPTLIGENLRAGGEVLLPIIEEIEDIQETEAPARTRQAG